MFYFFPTNKWIIISGFFLFFVDYYTNLKKENKVSETNIQEIEWIAKNNRINHSKILPIKNIPVLCYHAIRKISKTDSPKKKTYSVTPEAFALQMKALAENGYKTISPDQLYEHWTNNKPLPEKPIIITFDDGRKEQFTIGATIMEHYHFKGVFFIMTIAIGKKNYMTKEDIKTLSLKGHTIGVHSWDHQKITQYKKEDWILQLDKPKKQLENIIEKPIDYFAYPFGIWSLSATDSIKKHGYKMAFIVYGKSNPTKPFYTVPRIIVQSTYSIKDLLDIIKNKK